MIRHVRVIEIGGRYPHVFVLERAWGPSRGMPKQKSRSPEAGLRPWAGRPSESRRQTQL